MKRTLSFLMLGALLVLSACSSQSGVAASVNGHDISIDSVTRDLHGFAESNAFTTALSQQGVHLTKKGPVPTSFAAQWLVSLMQNAAVEQVASQRHVTATAREKAAATQGLAQSQNSGPAFAQLPKWLQRQISDASALQSALRASLKPVSNAPALAQAYQQLQADCASKKLVGHILVETPEQAQQVIDQIKKGTSFADVSKQVSKDTSAAAQGGLLTCIGSSQWSQLDADFRAGAEATPVGTLSQPVKSQFGYHVIEVLDLTEANAAPLVTATAQPADPLAPLLTKYLKGAKLYVNARFGKLRRQGGAFTIDPPTPKQTKSRPTTSSPASSATTAPAAGQSTTPSTTAPATTGTSTSTTP
ncbi:MAG: peptidylprolyl isomerase [Acidimicrobiia bacterium]